MLYDPGLLTGVVWIELPFQANEGSNVDSAGRLNIFSAYQYLLFNAPLLIAQIV